MQGAQGEAAVGHGLAGEWERERGRRERDGKREGERERERERGARGHSQKRLRGSFFFFFPSPLTLFSLPPKNNNCNNNYNPHPFQTALKTLMVFHRLIRECDASLLDELSSWEPQQQHQQQRRHLLLLLRPPAPRPRTRRASRSTAGSTRPPWASRGSTSRATFELWPATSTSSSRSTRG